MTSALPPEEEPQQNGRRHPNTALSDAIDKIEPKKRYPTGPIGPYHHAARWIARSEDPFVSFNRIFSLALGKDDEDEDDMEDDGDSELQVNNPYNRTKEEDRAHHLQMYKILRHRVPSVKDALITFGEERSGRMVALACYMAGVVSGARSDDIKGLKMVGLGYVAVFPGKSLGPEVLISPNKEETRGWNDPIISELLCPIEHLDTFRMDPEGTRRKFQDGVIELTADQAAPYMYLHADPDPAHPYEGLFRSELIKKTWRHIYQSPSSAAANRAINVRRGEGDSKKPQTVTPATIAYATMHTYWFLCACSDWRSPEGSGAQAIVFMAVLKIFQMRGMETWAKETLEEWNEEMFPVRSRRAGFGRGSLSRLLEHGPDASLLPLPIAGQGTGTNIHNPRPTSLLIPVGGGGTGSLTGAGTPMGADQNPTNGSASTVMPTNGAAGPGGTGAPVSSSSTMGTGGSPPPPTNPPGPSNEPTPNGGNPQPPQIPPQGSQRVLRGKRK